MNNKQWYAYLVICFILSFIAMSDLTLVIWIQLFCSMLITGVLVAACIKYIRK